MTNDEINPILIYPDNQTAPISRRDFFAAHALNGLLHGSGSNGQPLRLLQVPLANASQTVSATSITNLDPLITLETEVDVLNALKGLHGDQPKGLDYIVTEAVRIADFLIDKLDNTDND